MIKLNFIKHLLFLSIITTIVSCRSTEKLPENQEVTTTTVTSKTANDKEEHDIIIIDPGYETWLASTAKPKGFYNQTHLENNNLRYVTAWNTRVLQPQKYSSNLYEIQINYNQSENYGYDVNYKLYNYFIYFQNKYKQNLLGGRIPTN